MKKKNSGGKRIVVNSLALYLKMLYSILIAFYTTRVVLSSLGAEDYGIYILVAGVISLLTFLNVSMTVATQRFMSVAMGKADKERVKKIFATSVFLHWVIGITVILGLEIAGLFLFDGVLNIPEQRIQTAKVVFQFMVVSTFFTINAVPYDAAINANEHMWIDSLIGLIENTLKLGIAFYLMYSSSSDKLISYSLLTVAVIILSRISKSYYCRKKYEECKINNVPWKNLDYSLVKEMGSFAGWNTIGALVYVGRSQTLAVILNIFYGTVINAAYGIANQINSQVAAFSTTLLKAINPQIAKSEGAGDRSRMLQMAGYSTKLSFFIFTILLVPLYVEMPYVLELWLKNVPEYTISFCKLLLCSTLLAQLSNGLMLIMQSYGRIKEYIVSVNIMYALNIPIAYLLLTLGYAPYFVVASMIVIEVFALMIRVFWVSKFISEFNSKKFLLHSVLKSVLLGGIVLGTTSFISNFLEEGIIRFVSIILFSTILSTFLFYILILGRDERMKIKMIFIKMTNKFF